MTPFRRLIALSMLCLLASACMRSAPEPPAPTERKYLLTQGIKYEDVWVAAVRAMTKSLNVQKMDQKEGFITGSLADWGFRENLTVIVKPDPSQAGAYRLDVVSTRNRSAVMRDWAEDMLKDLEGLIENLPNYQPGGVYLVKEPIPK
ncbi:DUF3568 family protein [Desulfarculales bacterium]